MNAVYVGLGFTANAALKMVTQQSIDSLEELRELDDKEVENLCRVLRKPGGFMPNPNADPDPAMNQPAEIFDPGTQVSTRAENLLKQACFWARNRHRLSRVTVPGDLVLAAVRTITSLRKSELAHKDPDPPTINELNWPKTFEALEEYFSSYLGESGIPLAYVTRPDVNIPADPDPSANYANVRAEMISRAPHDDEVGNPLPTYLTDRGKVWELLAILCREKPCWSYMKPAQRSKDGRQGYLALEAHYLGPNNVDNMASSAERKLKNTTYLGEKRRWTFENFVQVHVDQHAILAGLVDHGYSGIDERSKVRHLMDGIKTRDLISVQLTIMASAELRSDFTGCVRLYKDFLAQGGKTDMHRELQISETGVRPDDGDEDDDDDEVEDRYYSSNEYQRLNNGQKLSLQKKREGRGHKPGDMSSKKRQKTGGQGEKKGGAMAKMARQVAKLTAMFAARNDSDNAGGDEPMDTDEPQDATANRHNPALTRQGRRSSH